MFGFGKKDSKLKVVKPKVPINTPDTSGPDSGLKQNLGMFSDTASPGTSWKFDKQAGKAKVNLKGEVSESGERNWGGQTFEDGVGRGGNLRLASQSGGIVELRSGSLRLFSAYCCNANSARVCLSNNSVRN